jgi:isopenicillin N synthase-like dioxygenase
MSILPQNLPVAQLRTVQLSDLLQGDDAEAQKLFEACKMDGFFYLNIKNIDEHVLEVIDGMFELDKELYDLPDEEKMLYDVDKISDFKLNGYDPRHHPPFQPRK